MQINQLTSLDSLSGGDQVVVFSTANGDTRKISAAALRSFIADGYVDSLRESAQYLAPNTTGFTVTIQPVTGGNDKWLKMMPSATLAAGTITLPDVTTADDGQELLVTSTQAITALTVAANGATSVYGAPTTLAANGFFKLRYDLVSKSWFRIG
jgi:hypothetical protein